MRNLIYFDGHAMGAALALLTLYALGGALAVLVAGARERVARVSEAEVVAGALNPA